MSANLIQESIIYLINYKKRNIHFWKTHVTMKVNLQNVNFFRVKFDK